MHIGPRDWRSLVTLAACFSLAVPGLAESQMPKLPALTEQNLAARYEFIRPKPEEVRWREIPWRTSLWEGIQEAQAKERPILFWTMDGHPLACT